MTNEQIEEMLVDWLKKNKYEGVFCDSDCACTVKNGLRPCCSPILDVLPEMTPGIQVKCDCGEHDFHIVTRKEKADASSRAEKSK